MANTDDQGDPMARSIHTAQRIESAIGWTLFFLSLAIFYATVLRVDFFQTSFINLHPQPDAGEYYAVAYSLHADAGPYINIAGQSLPSRYPPGYPILMQGWFSVLSPNKFILAPFRTNQTLGFLLLIVAFVGFGQTYLQGGTSSLLLASLPSFSTFARSSMSEIGGALFIALAFVLLIRAFRCQRCDIGYWGCAMLGLACNVRLQLILFAPLILLVTLCGNFTLRRRVANGALGGVVLLAATSPTLIMNYALFGSPFLTGYHFWIPNATRLSNTFRFRYLGEHLQILIHETFLISRNFQAANIFGTGAYFTPAFLALGLLGIAIAIRRYFIPAVALSAMTFLVGTMTYYFQNNLRLYFPLLVLLTWTASIPVAVALSSIVQGRLRPSLFLPLLLFALSVIGTPSLSWWPPRYTSSQLVDLATMTNILGRSREFEAAKHASQIVGDRPALIFSDIFTPYLATFLPKVSITAPITSRHPYIHGQQWNFNLNDALQLINIALNRNWPVLAVAPAGTNTTTFLAQLPTPTRTKWENLVASPRANEVLMFRLIENP